MFWKIVLAIVFYFVGMFIGAYGIIQILICLKTGLKFAGLISTIDADDGRLIKKRYITSIVILILLTAIVIALIVIFGTKLMKISTAIGIGIAFILGVGKIGIETNAVETVQTNIKYMKPETFEKFNEITKTFEKGVSL